MSDEFHNNFEVLYGETETNYETDRILDSAKGFEYLAKLCLNQGFIEEYIYFTYRSAVSWSKIENSVQQVAMRGANSTATNKQVAPPRAEKQAGR